MTTTATATKNLNDSNSLAHLNVIKSLIEYNVIHHITDTYLYSYYANYARCTAQVTIAYRLWIKLWLHNVHHVLCRVDLDEFISVNFYRVDYRIISII